ncbi:MAG: manganese-binding transcriptional regulator MntR [Phycisphaeraceae bacterium]|nr:manganese-binding transcriptional regulator MntR [Phycisphaerae bacterium]MBX3392578.1 manganese-binding transcriptional regulator MntR [Phycisphaeraceae bacterium]HRJ50765.1 manganese-binding transcriptional regulator MntR [Phycisphaerales bacterium]
MPSPTRRRNPRAKTGSTSEPARPRSAALQAAAFRRTRRAHFDETAEDYVEAVGDLIATRGEARVVDLARMFGVTHVTVSRTITRLQARGLVTCEPYRSIFLTDDGRRLADRSKKRHEVVVAFLRSLGISRSVAEADAEGIEHHVSTETLAALERFLARPAGSPP